jgi:hypothetical protein
MIYLDFDELFQYQVLKVFKFLSCKLLNVYRLRDLIFVQYVIVTRSIQKAHMLGVYFDFITVTRKSKRSNSRTKYMLQSLSSVKGPVRILLFRTTQWQHSIGAHAR